MLIRVVFFFVCFLFCIPLIDSYSYSSPLDSFKELQSQIEDLQKQLIQDDLTLSTLTRPENCPLAGPTFREIADKMAAISSSLSDSKCYEKHAAVIREINRASKTQADASFEFIPGENGAFVENDSSTNINITNNQYQSVQTNTSLISGLFEISKDKECVESLRKSGHLSTVAQTLSRFGTMGLVLPSSVGMLGSTAILAAAGGLYVLDKLIQPKFSWKYAKDRGDFMALTCSFYNLRTQLHESGFFDIPPENIEELLKKAEGHLATLEKLAALNRAAFQSWMTLRQKEMRYDLAKNFKREDNNESRIQLYLDLDQAITFLKSPTAYGRSNTDRFEVRNFFLRHFAEYRTFLPTSRCPAEFCEKVLTDLHTFIGLSEAQLLALTMRQWMARVTSFQNFFEDLIKNDFSEMFVILNHFNQQFTFHLKIPNGKMSEEIYREHVELRNRIQRLHRDLTVKISNLERMQKQRSFSSYDEGAQSEYDIRREFTVIKNLILGRKGWNFVRFLIQDANQAILQFKVDFKRWDKMKDLPNYQKRWACRDANEMSNLWGTADKAVDLAYGFLGANNDLWTSFHPHFETLLHFPYARSYYRKLYKAVVSAEAAKTFLHLSEEEKTTQKLERIEKLSSTYFIKRKKVVPTLDHVNLGRTMIEVEEQKKNRQAIREYQRAHCGANVEL